MFSSLAVAVFSVLCLDMAASAPPKRPDDITCKNVTYWDCQSSISTKGLPSCGHEEVCKRVRGKIQCRDLPMADRCLKDSGKNVCTKKTGETCRVVETHNATTTTTTTTASPTLDYYDDSVETQNATTSTATDSVGCTTGEDIVCRAVTEKPTYPECSKKEEVCNNVNGQSKCREVTPPKCLSVTGKLCITEKWTVCGPGTSDDSEVIIAGEDHTHL